MKSKWLKVACAGMVVALALPFVPACGGSTISNEDTVLNLSTGDLDGVFNPFFATSAYDSAIVGQTQISMLGSDDAGENVTYGVNEPVVTLDYNETSYRADGTPTPDGSSNGYTVYQMVLKNDILFSDGQPLTAHDVLFNLYMYLDPNYTGSSTLYSTDIQGLAAYQAQDPNATDDSLDSINSTYSTLAGLRANAVSAYVNPNLSGSVWRNYVSTYNTNRLNLFETFDEENEGADLASQYVEYGEEDIQEDIQAVKDQFREDLGTVYNGIDMTTYQEDYPFDSSQTWQGFFYEIGLIQRQYRTVGGVIIYDRDENGKYIIDWMGNENLSFTNDAAGRSAAIEFAYEALCADDSSVSNILSNAYTSTGDNMQTTFAAEDREYYYGAVREYNGGRNMVESISGIKILDASEFDGETQYAEGEYDMLQITINGVDPRAKWNFAFTVAPMHYYTTPELNAAAMADENYEANFGVEYSSQSFMDYVRSRNSVPVGAGVYQASTINDQTLLWEVDENGNQTQASQDSWQTVSDGFNSNNIVYLIRNDNYVTTGGNQQEVYNARIKHVQYKVISSAQIMTSLQGGSVDFADPQATTDNSNTVASTPSLSEVTVQSAGYGYIGFNASFIPNIYIRRALMTVMNIDLVQSYYPERFSEPVYRCFSTTSWVYNNDQGVREWNPESYYGYDGTFETARELLYDGGCTYQNNRWYDEDGQPLEFTFTIAGDTRDHPATNTFLNAINILEANGISATLVTDARALYKLASGGLAIWAAAWSSSVDPDMYQVYHSESRATSVLNWGYDAILEAPAEYPIETNIMSQLDALIEEGREYTAQSSRRGIYREASDLVMELAVELPIYQRSDMYVYNNTKIDGSTLYGQPTPYASPLSEIWKVSFIEG